MGSAVKSRALPAAVLVLAAAFSAGCPDRPETNAARILRGESVPVREDVVELSGVSLDRFEEGRVRRRALVDRARIDRVSGIASGTGVVIESRDQREERGAIFLRAREMTWDAKRELAEAPAPIELEGENFTARGGKLRVSTSSGAIEVEGPVIFRLAPR